MYQLLSQVSDSVTALVASAAPVLTAIRIGQNRFVAGFVWHPELVVTSDQALPAAGSYTIVLSSGALISAQPGPRDPVNDLACLRPDAPIPVTVPPPAQSASIGALVLALGADFDGSPTVRLTTIHGFPRSSAANGSGATITLDLSGDRVSQGGMVLDAGGRLLGMTGVSPSGGAIVVPHGVIARFVEAATGDIVDSSPPALPERAMALPAASQPIPRAVQRVAPSIPRDSPPPPVMRSSESRQGGGSRRGWMGASLQPITVPGHLAHRAGQHTARQVVGVTRGGPADQAGLRSGDVLLALDGASTSGNHALRAFLVPERIGSTVEVRLMRDGLVQTALLTIAAQPD